MVRVRPLCSASCSRANVIDFARLVWIAVGIGVAGTTVHPQVNGAKLEFEVASIRPVDQMALAYPWRIGPVIFQGQASLKDLIGFAYKLERYQIIGSSPWIEVQRYEVTAKAESAASSDQIRDMVAALLSERFQLRIHKSSQGMSVYVLTLGRKGPRLKPAKEGTPRDGRGAIQKTSSGVVAHGATMGLFARFLTIDLGRPVVDYTGLEGIYDFHLRYDEFNRIDSSVEQFGSIFSALNDIGLRLESKKAPISVLVVDGAEQPSPN